MENIKRKVVYKVASLLGLVAVVSVCTASWAYWNQAEAPEELF
jgi:cyclic lactone autoinducer peptide